MIFKYFNFGKNKLGMIKNKVNFTLSIYLIENNTFKINWKRHKISKLQKLGKKLEWYLENINSKNF